MHRDIKPSNILLDEDDFAYLIGFAEETSVTVTGAMIGTGHYIAPERLRPGGIDARADIYALACVLYECLTGHPPFPGDSLESQLVAHLTDPPPQPSTTQPNVPAQFDAVIAKGMAKDPDERYATTMELADDARDAITIPIPRPTPSPAHTGRGVLVLRYAARSDRGLDRAGNEDSVCAGARLLAIADGMGKPLGGEVASRLIIAALAHLDDEAPGYDMVTKLDQAVRDGNAAIAAHATANPALKEMGTTLTAIYFAGDSGVLAHIGGSRAYLLRDGDLDQITRDEFLVGPNVNERELAAAVRTRLMRRLTGAEVPMTLKKLKFRAGDRYLLCTHGLSDPVSQETICEALKIPDVAESADRLIELALRGGGPDNVTVVVADVVL